MNVCKICDRPIKQSAVTGGWFHTTAQPFGHAAPQDADDLTAVAEAVGVLR